MYKGFHSRGFALPTVLITSVTMIIILLAALQSVTSITVSIDNQYYQKILKEAGESGVATADACLKNSGVSWTSPLRPTSDCTGSATDSYVISTPRMRSTFEVQPGTVNGEYVKVTVNSKLELLRASSGQPWKTYTASTNANILYPIFDITAGNYTTCSTVNGVLWCWGDNSYGQIGDGTTIDRPEPTKVIGGGLSGKYVYKATTGLESGCAIAGTNPTATYGDTKIYCWGLNSSAQLGLGNTTNSTSYRVPTLAATSLQSTLPNLKYTDISAGRNTCVVGEESSGSSRVWCWSQNYTGQGGDDESYDPKVSPIQNSFGTAGSPNYGAIYSATNNNTNPGKVVIGIAKQISMINTSFGCVITTNNLAYCWGSNGGGGMGVGTTTQASLNQRAIARLVGSTPSDPVHTSKKFKKVFVNWGRACAIGAPGASQTVDGKLYCWGYNGDPNGAVDYRISADITGNQYGDVQDLITSGTYASARFSDLAAADWATCVLGANGSFAGKVYCFGYNYLGALGNGEANVSTYNPQSGTTTPSGSKPVAPRNMVEVKGALEGKTVVKLAAGNRNVCAMTIGGASYCWGGNEHGQVGDGTVSHHIATPTRTKVPSSVVQF